MQVLSCELVCSFTNGDLWLNSQLVITIWDSRLLPECVIWFFPLVFGELVLRMPWLNVPHGRRGEPSMWAPISQSDYVALTLLIISDLLQLRGWYRLLQVSSLQSDRGDTGRSCILFFPPLAGRPLPLALVSSILGLSLTLRSLRFIFLVLFHFSISLGSNPLSIFGSLALLYIRRVSMTNSLIFLDGISRFGSWSVMRPLKLRWL